MPHSVAPINVAVCNKSKAAFRQPPVRKDHKGGERESAAEMLQIEMLLKWPLVFFHFFIV